MSQRSNTHPPLTVDPAPGLREQIASALFRGMPEMTEDIATSPREGEHVLDFARRLGLGTTPEEAVTLMAFALLPRPVIWWGHESLKAMPDLLTDSDRGLLEICASWVAEPDEPHRYKALDTGLRTAVRGPGAWLAIAVGWSGGSMAPAGMPAAPAPPHALGRAVNAAVLTSLARVPQDKRRRMLDHYVAMAEVLAKSA